MWPRFFNADILLKRTKFSEKFRFWIWNNFLQRTFFIRTFQLCTLQRYYFTPTLSAKTLILCNKKGKYHWDPRGIPRYTVNVPCSLQNVATGDEMSRQLTWGGKGGTHTPCCPFYEVHSCMLSYFELVYVLYLLKTLRKGKPGRQTARWSSLVFNCVERYHMATLTYKRSICC